MLYRYVVVVPPESNRRSFRRGQENCKYFGQSVPPLLSINVTPCQPHLGLIHLSLPDIFHIFGCDAVSSIISRRSLHTRSPESPLLTDGSEDESYYFTWSIRFPDHHCCTTMSGKKPESNNNNTSCSSSASGSGSARRSVFGFFKKRTPLVHDSHEMSLASPSTTAVASLCRLPTELLLMIVAELSFPDLLHLRASCRAAQELLSQGDLLQEWMHRQTLPRHELEPGDHVRLYVQLYPPTNGQTLEYLLNQHRRISTAVLLATRLDSYVEQYAQTHPGLWVLRDAATAPFPAIVCMTCPEYAEVQDKLVPCLLVIQHYLEHLRNKLHDLAEARWSDTSLIWSRLQEVTFHTYNRKDVISAHEAFQVLCWLMARLLDPSSDFRARRIALRGMNKRSISDQDVRQFVVLGNLRGLAELLSPSPTHHHHHHHHKKILSSSSTSSSLSSSSYSYSYEAREKIVLRLVRSHDPTRNKNWLQAWSGYRPEYRPIAQSIPTTVNVLNLQFGFQEVWMRSAVEYLSRHRLLLRGGGGGGGGMDALVGLMEEDERPSRRTVDGYTDIAGYHMVQGSLL